MEGGGVLIGVSGVCVRGSVAASSEAGRSPRRRATGALASWLRPFLCRQPAGSLPLPPCLSVTSSYLCFSRLSPLSHLVEMLPVSFYQLISSFLLVFYCLTGRF